MSIDKKLDYLRDAKAQLDEQIEDVEQSILNLERAKSDSDLSRTLQGYQDALKKKANEYESQKEIIGQLKDLLQKEFGAIKELVNLLPSQSLKAFVNYMQTNDEALSADELESHLQALDVEVSSYKQAYFAEKDKVETDKRDLSEEIRISQMRINQLKRHVKTYPNYVETLIRTLNDELSSHYQKEVRVRPLCEMIEVNDEKWRNALEGYLSTQRFDIIVDPTYFSDALDIYDRVKFDLKIYGVGLVNTQKLVQYDQVNPGTLAEKSNDRKQLRTLLYQYDSK